MRIATAKSRMQRQWHNTEVTWEELVKLLSKDHPTGETMAAYRTLPKDEQDRIKDVGGFVGGYLHEGIRKASNVECRSLLTIDLDNCGEGAELDLACAITTAAVVYSTHKHTPQHPRLRVVMPLSREVTAEEYVPLCRKVASHLGMEMCDDTTYEPCRLMYWPSRSVDGERVLRVYEGDPVDVGAVLGEYRNWRDASEWPLSSREAGITARVGKTQEDPTTKGGVIGAFCRTYSISEAINAYLPDVYEPTTEGRYSYKEGSTSNGVVTYEDKWLYSHHATDPVSGKLCNAFDLVRIHLFGEMDAKAKEDTPPASLPSWRAMTDLATSDASVKATMAFETMAEAQRDFGLLMNEQMAEAKEEKAAADEKKDAKAWTSLLSYTKKGELQTTIDNARIIIDNDPMLSGRVVRDGFTHRDIVVKDLPWRNASDKDIYWSNEDSDALLCYMSGVWHLEVKDKVLTALNAVMQSHKFHPVVDYLGGLKWDGVERLDTLLIDYLGAEDTELTRAMTRKHFTAAVARIMKPGCKYDYVLTLIGPEGVGKSTIVRAMGLDWYSDSLVTIEGKEGMEAVQGKWLIEMGELTSYKKSTVEMYKAFLSKQDDTFRPAYARNVEVYPRQCVFFATTNETYFLKGDSGNRRFWTVEVAKQKPTADVFKLAKDRALVSQIWAEALHRYNEGEPLYLSAELERLARLKQASYSETEGDERKGMIEAFLRTPVPEEWDAMSKEARRSYILSADILDTKATHMREYICAVEILCELFGEKQDEKTKYKTREIGQMLRSLGLKEVGNLRGIGPYGRQRYYDVKSWLDNITIKELFN